MSVYKKIIESIIFIITIVIDVVMMLLLKECNWQESVFWVIKIHLWGMTLGTNLIFDMVKQSSRPLKYIFISLKAYLKAE